MVHVPVHEFPVTSAVAECRQLELDVLARIEACIKKHSHLRGYHLRCSFHEGLLTVHGRVRSYHHKQLVNHAFDCVEEVTRLLNSVEVDMQP